MTDPPLLDKLLLVWRDAHESNQQWPAGQLAS
jgi:hypothetical protein